MNIEPSGTFLYAANQNTDSIAVFRIQPSNGKLQFMRARQHADSGGRGVRRTGLTFPHDRVPARPVLGTP